ncbi:MAG: hypothetical protein GX810_09245 [Clostridiales bacterium]|nr:hypothetical protein [Clostridiales bacterium]
MEHFELVEKLREKTGLSYEEAKQALEESNWDLLEAMVRLESAGKMNAQKQAQPEAPRTEAHQPEAQPQADAHAKAQAARAERIDKADSVLHTVGAFLSRIADLGMRNTLEMRRDSKVVMSLPLLVVVLLLIVAFWLVVPAGLVALAFGFRFGFKGKDVERIAHKAEAGQPQG